MAQKMLISQLSQKAELTIHTIRYYEKYGLIQGKKDSEVKSNNYKWYAQEELDRLELIKEAKAIGFTLSEIKKLINAWYSKRLSVERKIEILEMKIREVDEKIMSLQSVRHMLIAGIGDVKKHRC